MSGPTWELRKTGHPGNWTRANADFCLGTAIHTVISLQSAPAPPTPLEFHEQFDDIVEVVSEDPEIYLVGGNPFLDTPAPQRFNRFRRGDRITGKASGHFHNLDPSPAYRCDIKDAPFIALAEPVHSLLEEPRDDLFYVQALWFRNTDIRIDYQVSKRYEDRQKALLEQLDEGGLTSK
jgi:hypothetical protein